MKKMTAVMMWIVVAVMAAPARADEPVGDSQASAGNPAALERNQTKNSPVRYPTEYAPVRYTAEYSPVRYQTEYAPRYQTQYTPVTNVDQAEYAWANALQSQADYARTMAAYTSMARAAILSKFWIGVQCVPVSDDIREHVDLEDGVGVVVTAPLPSSPAAKAGLQSNDIIFAVNEQSIGSVADLTKAVDETEGKEFTIEWLRRGKRHSTTITADARPESKVLKRYAVQPSVLSGRLNPLIDAARVRQGAVTSYAMRTVKVPDDVEITWSRKGNGPSTIVVRQGDNQWTVTDNEWNSVPAKVKHWIITMMSSNFVTSPTIDTPAVRAAPTPVYLPGVSTVYTVPRRVTVDSKDGRIDEILKRLKRIEAQLSDRD